jgi:hypothetical protein
MYPTRDLFGCCCDLSSSAGSGRVPGRRGDSIGRGRASGRSVSHAATKESEEHSLETAANKMQGVTDEDEEE